MKKLLKITRKPLIYFMSIVLLASIGFFWSCTEEDDDLSGDPIITAITPESGMVATEVTITGSDFAIGAAHNTVSFNGVEATVIAANTMAIMATVPEGATTGDVIVTSNGKTSNAFEFTVTVPIIPTITSIDPASGGVDDIITITGTDFSTTPEDNEVSFNGAIATVTESTATTIKAIVPETATTGDVTVTVDGETSNGVMFTFVGIQITTLTIPIIESGDDAEEYRGAVGDDPDGYMDIGSSDLELCTQATDNMQMVGLIFRNVQIPVGATIKSAYIQFTCDDDDNQEGPLPINIWGINEANTSAPFIDELFNITGRPSTTATVTWDAPIWAVVDERGADQATADLSAIVQEIIGLSGWASGNNMGFKFTNDETLKIHREAESWDDNDGGPGTPALVVSFAEEK